MKTFSFPKARRALAEMERAALTRAKQTDVNYEQPSLAGLGAEQAPEETKEAGPAQKTSGKEKARGKKSQA